ncbi:MAG: hypothetical protein ACI8UO_005992 [Verrucomicrobiales bacterium]|jgi:hypothetical protein
MSAKITAATPSCFEAGTQVDLKVKAMGLTFNIGNGAFEKLSDFELKATGSYNIKIPMMTKLNGQGSWELTLVSTDSGENYEFAFKFVGEQETTKSLSVSAALEDGKIVYATEKDQRVVQSCKNAGGGLLGGGKTQLRLEVELDGAEVMVILQKAAVAVA